MIGICLICFLIFPFLAVFPAKRIIMKRDVLLDKDDTDVWKGIAACLIILAHLIIPMKDELSGISLGLHIYRVTGGMGVLIFFFISGYGVYKAYGEKLGIGFWHRRLRSTYLPSVVIQFISCLIVMWQDNNFNVKWLLFYSFLGAWFIVAIMIQYFIFYISWKMAKEKRGKLIIFGFIGSAIAAAIFYVGGFNPRWYNGLFLFPFGMLVGYSEGKITDFLQKRWAMSLFVSGSAFLLLGGRLRMEKDIIQV